MKTKSGRSNLMGLTLAAVAALAGLCITTEVQGAKPPAPSPPPDLGRVIYTTYAVSPTQIWSMKPDGTGKALLCGQYLDPAEPSRSLYTGQRWFLGWQALEGQYPDTYPRYGLCAVSQRGIRGI